MIRGQGTATVCGGERPAGQRANQKRMATVGAVYTVDPYVRTPEQVVAALFADRNAWCETTIAESAGLGAISWPDANRIAQA